MGPWLSWLEHSADKFYFSDREVGGSRDQHPKFPPGPLSVFEPGYSLFPLLTLNFTLFHCFNVFIGWETNGLLSPFSGLSLYFGDNLLIIWFDVVNSPHLRLFSPLIRRLEDAGLKCLVTSRSYGYLDSLFELLRVPHIAVGEHGGGDRSKKLLHSMERVKGLVDIVSGFKNEVSLLLSKASPEAVFVASHLGIPIITAYDNEFNVPQCKLTFPLSDSLLIPSIFPRNILSSFNTSKQKVASFNGVFEAAHIKYFKPSRRVLSLLGFSADDSIVVARPEPYQSTYFNIGKPRTLLVKIIKKLIQEVKGEDFGIVIFPRSNEQRKLLQEKFGSRVTMPSSSIDSLSLLLFSSVFLGGGGTMTREAALLGTPTISFYPGPQLAVNLFLIRKKLVKHILNPKAIVKEAEKVIHGEKEEFNAKENIYLNGFEDPVEKLFSEVSKYLGLITVSES